MGDFLSRRAAEVVPNLDLPFRFAPKQTYDPDSNPSGLINFATAENPLVAKELEDFASNVTIPAQSFGYAYSTGGGPRLPKALARHLNKWFHPHKPLDGSEIQITAAATPMHNILAWAVGDPGDGILVSRPVYGRFELDFGNEMQLKVVYADTVPDTSFDVSVVSKFEDALSKSNAAGVKIRALLIVNPNNPLGWCYSKETMLELMKFCQRHRIHFISDEVYGCSVFECENNKHLPGFTSALSIDPTSVINEELFHVTYGMSKDFAVPGLRIGAIVTRSKMMHKAVKSVMRFHNPAGPSVAIATAMLEDQDWCGQFLEMSRERIRDAYLFATKALEEMGIQYLLANTGMFVYMDLSPYLKTGVPDAEFELAQRLVDAGVFLQPREEHGKTGWFRLVYTQHAPIVAEGLKRYDVPLPSMSACR